MPETAARTDLEVEILIALGRGPLHGYAIIQDIEARAPELGDLRSGTLYLALRRLKADELIESCDPPATELGADARRKYVRLTEPGRAAARRELLRLRDRLTAAIDRDLLEPGLP